MNHLSILSFRCCLRLPDDLLKKIEELLTDENVSTLNFRTDFQRLEAMIEVRNSVGEITSLDQEKNERGSLFQFFEQYADLLGYNPVEKKIEKGNPYNKFTAKQKQELQQLDSVNDLEEILTKYLVEQKDDVLSFILLKVPKVGIAWISDEENMRKMVAENMDESLGTAVSVYLSMYGDIFIDVFEAFLKNHDILDELLAKRMDKALAAIVMNTTITTEFIQKEENIQKMLELGMVNTLQCIMYSQDVKVKLSDQDIKSAEKDTPKTLLLFNQKTNQFMNF